MRKRPILIVIVLLLLLAGAGIWYYLYGHNAITSEELVPDDTLFFASIPNGVDIATGYQTSQLRGLVESPNMQPVIDWLKQQIGTKNFDLIQTFLPNLSGQSFIAITHFDADHPEKTGFVAAMRPKPGLGNFNAFVDKLKAAYPEQLKEGKTGAGNVAGVDYQYLEGPGAADKICVAHVGGWIVTAWGEASFQDWLERYQRKSSTPSLAQNPDYKKSLLRTAAKPMALVYLNYRALVDMTQKAVAAKQSVPAFDFLAKKMNGASGLMVSMNFENGEMVDHLSFLLPRQAQAEWGLGATPCAYETLNFTGPDTLLYAGYNVDFKKVWQNLQEQGTPGSSGQAPGPPMAILTQAIQNWAQSAGIDFQHNILDALGPEVSWQIDWPQDSTYPDAGLFVKLAKPDDFKPAAKALVETVRNIYGNEAEIDEVTAGENDEHHFAVLKFANQALPFNPTVTEDGPYFGLFLTQQLAVRSFYRDQSINLTHNPDFMRQIGDKRNGSAEIVFVDSPKLLDQTYRTVLPYVSMAAMFSQTLASTLKGTNLPPDLTWLAPIGTWSAVLSSDDDGFKGYSVSGIGNQGLYYGALAAGAMATAQAMGYGANLEQSLSQSAINNAPGTGTTGLANPPPPNSTANATPTAATPMANSPANPATAPNSMAPATNSEMVAPAPNPTASATNSAAAGATPIPELIAPATNSGTMAPAPGPSTPAVNSGTLAPPPDSSAPAANAGTITPAPATNSATAAPPPDSSAPATNAGTVTPVPGTSAPTTNSGTTTAPPPTD
ncbi:MAG TPA: DUF3352 domain-containing protein [Candidatus Methylacidiphilales bacterium]|nr:DUF3352 domain-containing protein [Candidatus Methylacidiphilales bacterium]